MGRGIEGAVLRLLRAQDFTSTVVDTAWLSPTMRTIVFHAPEVFDAYAPQNGEFFRCWFPDPSTQVEHQRGYTITAVDEASARFTMHFLIHEPTGPAAAWALSAEPGDALALTRYGSKPIEAPDTSGVVIAADAAGIPFLNSCLTELPAEVGVHALVQEYDPRDRQIPIDKRAGAEVTWCGPSAGELIAAAEALDWSERSAVIVSEASVAKALKKHLIHSVGLPRARVRAQAYWVAGQAMGTQRDR